MNKSFYITTTIPYVNAEPHVGFALEIVGADTIARYKRLAGHEVFFSTGSDEYGQKIWEAASKEGKNVQEYVDYYANSFEKLKQALNLSYDNFIRTTSHDHIKASQKFWELCDKSGDIYKKSYSGLYCVGCEKYLKEKDLDNNKCILHPNSETQTIEEENYFFRLSKYKNELLEYLSKEDSILPDWRREEAIAFVNDGLEDFSISRPKDRISWGIPVPGDDNHVMYVWFGAFVNYISSLGWPNNKDLFNKFWEEGVVVQVAGKDMIRFQSIMWQGMLISAGLKKTDKIVYHGFITSGDQKMSKSLGNVINPYDIVKEYGTDALRYYLLRHIHPFEDSDMTMEKFKEVYNANLANGLGNLVSRIMTMAENYKVSHIASIVSIEDSDLDNFDIKKYMDKIWFKIENLDKKIQTTEPYKLFKTNEEMARGIVSELCTDLSIVAKMLQPVLPETSQKIIELLKQNKKPEQPLFLRKE